MSVYSISFSPTGGTKKVADRLAAGLGGEFQSLDLTSPGTEHAAPSFHAGDICVVAVPSYGGRVPAAAAERLGRLRGGGAKAVLTVVYGNRAFEDTLLELKEVLTQAGFHCAAAVAAVAEHSVMRQFASGRPDQADLEELDGFARRIRAAIADLSPEKQVDVPGSTPHKEYNGIPLKPAAGERCVRCGQCAKRCPVGAIPAEDPSRTDTGTCISCMRCIQVCPVQARSMDQQMLAGVSQRLEPVCSVRKGCELFLV